MTSTDTPPYRSYELEIDLSPDDMHPDRLTPHVNNARYFLFINQAFQQWYALVGTRKGVPGHGAPMAHLEYDFKREVNYPGRVRVCLQVVRVGRSSMEHAIEIFDVSDGTARLAGSGRSVHVWTERASRRAVPWPAQVLARCWSDEPGAPRP